VEGVLGIANCVASASSISISRPVLSCDNRIRDQKEQKTNQIAENSFKKNIGGTQKT
jgi:hypothetical protein